jgi:SRSO17 transposase
MGAGPERPKTWVIRGRRVTPCEIATARQLAEEFAAAGRFRIALELARHWQWRTASGKLKQRSALAILAVLEKRGWLRLPPPLIIHGPVRKPGRQPASDEVRAPQSGVLTDLRPFCWQLVDSAGRRRQWRELLARHHYLGVPGLVGAHLQYLIYSRQGDLLGAIGWQSAVERLDCRDRLAALNGRAEWRARFLAHAVNNVRFLIVPWLQVRHLASALLGESLKRLQKDWPRRYGSPVWLAESFVDRARFSAASYRAANWVALGWTRGYAKQQGRFLYHGHRKEIYVYVIQPRLRQLLLEDPAQPLLTREFLLAQRPTGNPPPQTRRKSMSENLSSCALKLPPHWELSAADLENVRQDLNEFTALFHDAFGRVESTELCDLYFNGLLSDAARKNVEAIALEIADPKKVRNLQRFISEYKWDEGWMRQEHWKQAAQDLADEQGVWSIDASEFPKKGEHSVGVAPQYCGALGKTANCQSGVFLCYSSPKGHTLLDARLYLPRCWFEQDYQQLREDCRVPKGLTFQTKPELALALGAELWQSQLFPGQWITCDCSFGNNEGFLAQLPKDKFYLAEISCARKVWLKAAPEHPELERQGCTVEQPVEQKNLLTWYSRPIAEGEKGPLVASFARVRVYLNRDRTPESERTLLLRNDPDGRIKYALSNAPEETPLSELIRVSQARWPIERCFQEGKSDLGLDHYEHRSWAAWHRHMRLVFLAHLFLLRLRLKYKKSPGADAATGSGPLGMEPASSQGSSHLRLGVRQLSPAT